MFEEIDHLYNIRDMLEIFGNSQEKVEYLENRLEVLKGMTTALPEIIEMVSNEKMLCEYYLTQFQNMYNNLD